MRICLIVIYIIYIYYINNTANHTFAVYIILLYTNLLGITYRLYYLSFNTIYKTDIVKKLIFTFIGLLTPTPCARWAAIPCHPSTHPDPPTRQPATADQLPGKSPADRHRANDYPYIYVHMQLAENQRVCIY